MDGFLSFIVAAHLTYTIVGGSVFVGLPSTVRETVQVCVGDGHIETCVIPDNTVVISVPWLADSVTYVKALVTEINGMQQWHTAYPLPPFVGD